MPQTLGPRSAAKQAATLLAWRLMMKLICPWRHSTTSLNRCLATHVKPHALEHRLQQARHGKRKRRESRTHQTHRVVESVRHGVCPLKFGVQKIPSWRTLTAVLLEITAKITQPLQKAGATVT